MDDAGPAAASALAALRKSVGAPHLRDTVRASELALRCADEVVRNARAAIATSEQRIRSAQLLLQALRATSAHRAQLRDELNGSGDQSPAAAEAGPRAALSS